MEYSGGCSSGRIVFRFHACPCLVSLSGLVLHKSFPEPIPRNQPLTSTLGSLPHLPIQTCKTFYSDALSVLQGPVTRLPMILEFDNQPLWGSISVAKLPLHTSLSSEMAAEETRGDPGLTGLSLQMRRMGSSRGRTPLLILVLDLISQDQTGY